MTTRQRISRQRSIKSIDSNGQGSLYPDVSRASTETRGSLWRQYSLIVNSTPTKNEKTDCRCWVNQKQRRWILKITFLVVVALGLIVSSFCMRFSKYSRKRITITGGDQILLPTSTYINKELTIAPQNQHDAKYLKLYLLKKNPLLSNSAVNIKYGGKFYIASWTYQYWGLHLLEGSKILISLCADLQLQFYILRGEKKFKLWTQQTLFNRYDYHSRIYSKQNCTEKYNFKSHVLTVTKSDIYYLFFVSSVGWRFLTEVTVNVQFNRTYYDLSNAKYSCWLNEKSCIANLSYGTKDIALVHAVYNPQEGYPTAFHNISLTYSPSPRLRFYYIYIGGIYACVVTITIVYTIWRAIVNAINPEDPGERKPLLYYQPFRPASLSLLSASGSYRHGYNKNTWVVVSPLEKKPESRVFDVRDRDLDSLLTNGEQETLRRESLLSDLSVSSRESDFVRTKNENAFREEFEAMNRYMDEQQLLDSVMTSAGVSAI